MDNPLLPLDTKQAHALSRELRHSRAGSLFYRRAVAVASLVGMAAMARVTLLQMGVVKHLPDPPFSGFDSDSVNTAPTAYRMGIPDGTLSLASLALNLPLAAWGGASDMRQRTLLPLAFAGKALVEAAVGAWFFRKMPKERNAWCVYCIVGAAANVAVAAFSLPEAWQVLRGRRQQS